MGGIIDEVVPRGTAARQYQLGAPPWLPRVALTGFRILPLIPLSMIMFLIGAALLGTDHGKETLEGVTPVLLGNAALYSLAVSFGVTTVSIVTGWRWHLILRRDFGLWAFTFAALDMSIALTTSASGWRAGIAGQAFLAAAALAVLLLIPLAVTSNRWSMRHFGKDWKRLHKLVYVVLALIAVHLLLLPSGPGEFGTFLILFGPSLLLRVPPVRRWAVRTRGRLLARSEA
jgi:sulfoxide reductase heme-binding subunit YedZ